VWGPTFTVGPPITVHRGCHQQPGRQLIGAAIAHDLSMNVRYVIGSLLVVVGLVSLLWGGFRWTQQKTVVDIGPIEAKTEEHKALPIPPVVGALVLVGGIVLLVVPMKRRV
jgi:uncharacterized membrane protein YidH (DUF202 family)